jgi:hypothetical protein
MNSEVCSTGVVCVVWWLDGEVCATHYCTPEDGHNNARNMLSQQTSILSHLVVFYLT